MCVSLIPVGCYVHRTMSSPDSEVAEFFRGRSIFVTGASGLMGKVLLEKLLYNCSDLGAIYILMRSKRNKTPEQRAEEMFKIPVSFLFHCFLVQRSAVLVFLSLSCNFVLLRSKRPLPLHSFQYSSLHFEPKSVFLLKYSCVVKRTNKCLVHLKYSGAFLPFFCFKKCRV
jgi:hypothetical protein